MLNLFTPLNESQTYTGIVKSVLYQRYSNEVIIEITGAENTRSAFLTHANKAISYIGNDIKINPGDELEIHSKPAMIQQKNKDLHPFEIYLLRKGFHYIFYLNENNFKITKNSSVSFKDKTRNVIEDNLWKLFDKKTVPLLKGLYFANCSYIDKTTAVDFKRAGVLHILAASGEHVGIIAGALLILFSPLLINRKAIRVIIAAILLFYLYITDMPVSLVRAFIMYYVFSFQYFLDRDKNIFNILFISGIIILIINPFELYSLGFQLSFGATFGIIAFYNFYKKALSFLHSGIAKPLAVTFSAQTIVFPIIFIQMNEINLAGLLSNVILVFMMSVTLISSIIANVISIGSSYLAAYAAMITDMSYSFSLYLIKFFSKSNAHFALESKSIILLLPYLLFLLPVLPVPKNKRIMSVSIPVSVICAWFILSGNNSYNQNKITIFKKEILVLLKENNDPVVFGSLENIKDAEILAGYLNRNNIRNINLYIPMPDFTNLKNFSYLIKKTIVSRCIISQDYIFTRYFKKFCRLIDADGIKLKITDFKNYRESKNTMNYDPADIKISPIDNIGALYNLFILEYDLKTLVIEDIASRDFQIEYID